MTAVGLLPLASRLFICLTILRRRSAPRRSGNFRPDATGSLRGSHTKQIETEIVHEGQVFRLRSKEGHIGVFFPEDE